MDISQGSKQASEVRLDSRHRQIPEIISKIVVSMIWHDSDNLVTVSECSDKLRDMSATAAVFKNGYLIANAFRIGSYVYALDGDKDFWL